MPEAWRICKTKHAATAYDGEGARIYGGRWNSVGVSVVYTAATVSLAILEMLVHLDESEIMTSYSLGRVQFEVSHVSSLDRALLPVNWSDPSPVPELCAIGNSWVAAGRSVILEVPSVIVNSESCYLINPAHRNFSSLVFEPLKPFALDKRLFEF